MSEETESRFPDPAATYTWKGLAVLVRLVAGFFGGVQISLFMPIGLLWDLLSILAFFGGGIAVGWAVFAARPVLRILAWAMAGSGAGIMIESGLVGGLCLGDSITPWGLVGGAVLAIGAALSCVPAESTFHRIPVRRSRILLLYLLILGVSAWWIATTPKLERWRTAWRLRCLHAFVWSSEGEGTTVVFRGGTEDATLRAAKHYMEKLGDVHDIYLMQTDITDAGLVHLKELTALRQLDLSCTRVTDAGLIHLKGLTKLERLVVEETKIGDAGLEHLAGMTNLRLVKLYDTEVSEAGVEKLRQALPDANIDYWPLPAGGDRGDE